MAGRSRPTVSVWHRRLERAVFEEFWREPTGRVRFEGQRPTEAKPFRERVWSVFSRIRQAGAALAGRAPAPRRPGRENGTLRNSLTRLESDL
jgi:hypothetical protein